MYYSAQMRSTSGASGPGDHFGSTNDSAVDGRLGSRLPAMIASKMVYLLGYPLVNLWHFRNKKTVSIKINVKQF